MNVNIIRYDSDLNNGVNRYASTLYKGMNQLYTKDHSIKEIRVRKLELFGHFGIISTRAFSKLNGISLAGGDVNHSTAAFLDNKKVKVVTLHDVSFMEHLNYYDERYVRYNSRYIQGILSTDKKIIVPSNVVREMVIRNFKSNEENVIAVHHGIQDLPDTYIEQLQNPYTNDKTHLLIFGGLDNVRRKFDLILDLLKGTEYEVYLIGYGHNPVYDKFRNIENINFLGYQEDNRVHEFIRFSDLVLYNSIDEGFGYVPLEVFNLNRKILLNDAPVFREMCGDHAFYYKNDFSDFQDQLDRALKADNPSTRDYVRQNFSIEKMAENTMIVYKSS